ncbi:hypothetical protein, partial [Kitasatospora sp. NPDC002965]|uniref:hypothetical protein n=1 Tax=Kitasatospora sp. NPDC002965 TaxID=3154775 RepID=UPI0033A4B148
HVARTTDWRIAVTGGADSLIAAQILGQLLPDDLTVVEDEHPGGPAAVTVALLAAPDAARHVVADLGAAGADAYDSAMEILRPQILTVLPGGPFREGAVLLSREATLVVPAGASDLPTTGRLITYTVGEEVPAQVRAEDVLVLPDGRTRFTLAYGPRSRVVDLPLHGPDHLLPALAAAATALAAGQRLQSVVDRLKRLRLPSGCLHTETADHGARLLYADGCGTGPQATTAALRVLHRRATQERARAVALLGEPPTPWADPATARVRETVTTYAVEAAGIGAAAADTSPHPRNFATTDDALTWLRDTLTTGPLAQRPAVVLLKGSAQQYLTTGSITAQLRPREVEVTAFLSDLDDRVAEPSPGRLRPRVTEVAAAQVLAAACRKVGWGAASAVRASGASAVWRLDDAVIAQVHLGRISDTAMGPVSGAQWLAGRGIPVVEPAYPQPVPVADSCVTFWHDTGRWAAPPAAAGALLAAVHTLAPDGLFDHQPIRHLKSRLGRTRLVDEDRALLVEHLSELSARYAELSWPTPPTTVLGVSQVPNLRRDRPGAVRLAVASWPQAGRREWDLTVLLRDVATGWLHPDDYAAAVGDYERATGIGDVAHWPGHRRLIDVIDFAEALKRVERTRAEARRAAELHMLLDLVARQRADFGLSPAYDLVES